MADVIQFMPRREVKDQNMKQCCRCEKFTDEFVTLVDEYGRSAGRKYFCHEHSPA